MIVAAADAGDSTCSAATEPTRCCSVARIGRMWTSRSPSGEGVTKKADGPASRSGTRMSEGRPTQARATPCVVVDRDRHRRRSACPASDKRRSTSSKRSRAASGPAASARAAAGSHRHADRDTRQHRGHPIEVSRTCCSTARGRGRGAGRIARARRPRPRAARDRREQQTAREQPAGAHMRAAQPRGRGEDTEAAEYRKGYNRIARCRIRPL